MYLEKYLKYKTKYMDLKNQFGGLYNDNTLTKIKNVLDQYSKNIIILEDIINKINKNDTHDINILIDNLLKNITILNTVSAILDDDDNMIMGGFGIDKYTENDLLNNKNIENIEKLVKKLHIILQDKYNYLIKLKDK